MGIVSRQGKVVELKIKHGLYVGIDVHSRRGSRFTRQLGPDLGEVVSVDVGIAERVDELAGC